MALEQPVPVLDALEFFSRRAPVGSPRRTADWYAVTPDIRARSFFSATVESGRFLDRAHGLISDYLAGAEEFVPGGGTALKVGSRKEFVDLMRAFMVEEGMVSPDDFGDDRDIENLSGYNRLALIFDTNQRQAHGYAYWSQGLVPELLDSHPAWRFIRHPGAEEPRPRHVAGEGDIRLKTDFAYWADFQNAADIGGFGVPWPPFGFNSYMDIEDVDRLEAEAAGLVRPGFPVVPADEASAARERSPKEGVFTKVRGMLPQILTKVLGALGLKRPRRRSSATLSAEMNAREAQKRRYDRLDRARSESGRQRTLNAIERSDGQSQRRGTDTMLDHRLGPSGRLDLE